MVAQLAQMSPIIRPTPISRTGLKQPSQAPATPYLFNGIAPKRPFAPTGHVPADR
jgi:hypothetical protein